MPAGPRTYPDLRTVIGRGARRRCPHCGQGPVFERWFKTYARCSVCGLVYQRNPGDTWGFWVISDRLPIAIGIILLYFGFRATNWLALAGFFFAMVVPLVWSMPYRLSIAIALDYYTRARWPDPDDRLPALDGLSSRE